MLTFFRKIRKALLDSDSTKKYLLYAIGEVLLVMIGILLALQVNNWNEHRAARRIEQNILVNLHKEFLNNKQSLVIQNEDMQTQIEFIESLLDLQPNEVPDSVNLFDLFSPHYALRVATFQSSQSTLEEAIASGNLKLLKSNELRMNLTFWLSELDVAKEHESKMINLKELELRPFLIECCPRGVEFQDNYAKVLSDYRFRTIMELYQIMLHAQIKKRVRLQQIVEQVLKILEETIH